MRADRDASARDRDVRLERSGKRVAMRLVVVAHRSEHLHVREHRRAPRGSAFRSTRRSVRARAPRRRARSSVPVTTTRTRGRRASSTSATPRACKRAKLAGAEHACRARGRPRPPRRRRPALRMFAPRSRNGPIHGVCRYLTTSLDRDHGVGAFRDCRRRSRSRPPAPPRGRRPTGRLRRSRPTIASAPGVSAARTRESVHRRARERRQAGRRTSGLGKDSAERVTERDLLGRQRARLRRARRRSPPRAGSARPRRERYPGLVTLPRVLSIVVPVYNEDRSVAALVDELRLALELDRAASGRRSSSTTGRPTAPGRRSRGSMQGPDPVRVVRLRRNFGKAAALMAGFAHARGDVVVTIDGDLQDDPSEIPRLLAKLDEGFDLVSGWKTQAQATAGRAASLSRVYNRVTGAVTGVRLHDMNCGLKAYRTEVARSLHLYGELHRYVPGARALQGLPHRRAAGEPPAARARPLALRDRALRARASSTSSRSRSSAATATVRSTSSAASGCCSAESAS